MSAMLEERLLRRYERYMDRFEATGEGRFLVIALEADRLYRRVRAAR